MYRYLEWLRRDRFGVLKILIVYLLTEKMFVEKKQKLREMY